MDECWLDVTGSQKIFGSSMNIAQQISATVRQELGLTVSIGVSFNKIFAKLGSDMKKPDAITEITKDNFKSKVWPLPASKLLFVGRATDKKLARIGICTIGDIAKAPPEVLKNILGINGLMLWRFANGDDTSRVMTTGYESQIKSIGHGITCTADLENNEDVWKVMLELSQDIGHRLRVHELAARGVQLAVRDKDLVHRQYQGQIRIPTQSPMEIALKARSLFEENYRWFKAVRSITVRAINLVRMATPQQIGMFDDIEKREKRDRLEDAIYSIRCRFGDRAIYSAILMGDIKMSGRGASEIIMPGMMYK